MSTTQINLPYLAVRRDGPLHMEETLTRSEFNELTSHLVQATREPVR